LQNEWTKQGFDYVKVIDYDVLLDFPDQLKYNRYSFTSTLTNKSYNKYSLYILLSLLKSVELKNAEKSELFDIKENMNDSKLNYENITKPFLAYGSSGSVTSDELYYGNYCNPDDLEFVAKQGFNLTDKILLCKYGYSFRGNKVG
jgi:N-acetylated-alpha-linked acidic dipeptidase